MNLKFSAHENEESLENILLNAHCQIEEKQYEAELISKGFIPDQIRKYGFALKILKRGDILLDISSFVNNILFQYV